MTDTEAHTVNQYPEAYPDPHLVEQAVRNAILATNPRHIGDHGLAYLLPSPGGYEVSVVDERLHEAHPRERTGTFRFVDVRSFAEYVNRYKEEDTLAYAIDVPADAPLLLQQSHVAFVAVIDDYPTGGTSSRTHRATLELTPTVAARRWGAVLGKWINQEALLDLVVDGAGEVISPDAADLRDLAANLHAIRSVEVESVIRTGGEGTIAVSENVKLKAGASRQFTFPEEMSVTFTPFNREFYPVTLDVRVKATVTDKHVRFLLTAPTLADQLTSVIDGYAAQVHAATDLVPLWRPATSLNTASSAPYDI